MDSEYERIKKEVLQHVVADDSQKNIDHIIKKIEDIITEKNIKAEIFVGGSFAKNTFLAHDFDVDIFVRFDYELYKNKDISEILGRALESLSPLRIPGSRDYYQIQMDGYQLELVPVLHISNVSDALNITDCSPLHVSWVVEKIQQQPTLVDEIRLLKLFCKSAHVYGAESYINGLSGHVVDILTIFFGSFYTVVEKLKDTQPLVLINIHDGTFVDTLLVDDVLKMSDMQEDKILGPLVVVDPIASDRNAAAALSHVSFTKLQTYMKEYLQHPDVAFFEKRPLNEEYILRSHKDIIKLSFVTHEGKKDIVGSKVLKCIRQLLTQLQLYGFSLLGFEWEYDEKNNTAICYLFPQVCQLESTYLFRGPPLDKEEHVQSFKEQHSQTTTTDGVLYAVKERKYTEILIAIRDLLHFDTKYIDTVKVQKL